jgi:hypothetical protein
LEMGNCTLCNGQISADIINLRNGDWVHKLCVSNLESKISSINKDILMLRARLTESISLRKTFC